MIYTITIDAGQANKKIAAPVACNSNQNMCVYGTYCSSNADTCTGICHPSCFKCNGPLDTNCLTCSPLSKEGYNPPDAQNKCKPCK
jgi:hypothetical protein